MTRRRGEGTPTLRVTGSRRRSETALSVYLTRSRVEYPSQWRGDTATAVREPGSVRHGCLHLPRRLPDRSGCARELAGHYRSGVTAVVVVEPDPVVRRGLAAFVSADTDLTVVVEVARHDAELDHHLEAGVDVVLAGVSPEDRAAVALTRQLVRRKPSPAVVLVAARVSDALVRDAFRSGARGLLLRDSVADQLVDAIRSVVDGGTWVDSEVAAVLTALAAKGRAGATDERGLTVQERRVLRLLPRGLTNREIAEELGVAVDTVKTHLRNAVVKLGAHDRIEAARVTEREGID